MEFENHKAFERWLEGQRQEVCVAIAARAALRVWPIVSAKKSWSAGEKARNAQERLVLLTVWACLISGVASRHLIPDITSAAKRLIPAANDATRALTAATATSTIASFSPAAFSDAMYAARAARAATAAIYATRAATDATDATYATRATVSAATAATAAAEAASYSDAGLSPAVILSTPLWHETGWPVGFALGSTLLDTDPRLDFFKRWYDGMVRGAPMDWELQRRVALIPENIWTAGIDALAAAIAEIEAEWVSDLAKINERLVLDDSTLRYSAQPIEASNEERLARHLSRVEDALEDMLALGGNNGLSERAAEYRIIKRLVTKYPDDPERIAFDLTDVNRSIHRQIEVHEYADDEPIRLLQAANSACISTICDMEPDIAQELERVYRKPPVTLDEQDADLLETALNVSSAMLDAPAAETTREDAAEILFGEIIDAAQEDMPEGPRRMASTYRSIVLRRQISRLAQQARDWTKIPALAKHYDSDLSKAAGVVGRYAGVGGLLWGAVLLLGKLLGV